MPQPKGNGGRETRGLVPLGLILASDMQSKKPCDFHDTLVRLMARLLDIYMLTSCEHRLPETAANSCRDFLLLYGALSNQAADQGKDLWRVKPKFHLMQELCEFQGVRYGNPRNFWTDRDESFVGLIGTIARPRGGKHTAKSVPVATLNKYRGLVA